MRRGPRCRRPCCWWPYLGRRDRRKLQGRGSERCPMPGREFALFFCIGARQLCFLSAMLPDLSSTSSTHQLLVVLRRMGSREREQRWAHSSEPVHRRDGFTALAPADAPPRGPMAWRSMRSPRPRPRSCSATATLTTTRLRSCCIHLYLLGRVQARRCNSGYGVLTQI